MASSEVKAEPIGNVRPVGEDTLDFDDDTLKGEDSCNSLIRSRWTGKRSMLVFTVEREVSLVHGYSKLLRRSARTSYKLFPVFGFVWFLFLR